VTGRPLPAPALRRRLSLRGPRWNGWWAMKYGVVAMGLALRVATVAALRAAPVGADRVA